MEVFGIKDLERMSTFFRGERGHRRAEYFMHLFAIDRINRVYSNSGNLSGPAFASSLLNDLGVNYLIGNYERLNLLPEGGFITIANHPYGGLDGIILIDLIAGIRSDYKLMVNKMISLVKTMEENFISVTPVLNKKNRISAESIHGVRETLSRLKDGHPVGFFPSGAVSDFRLADMRIRDRNWQASIMHVIKSVKVPVLPIRFFDGNSPFFYFLGLINWRIRSLRMPSEVFNKRKQNPRIGIGNIIPVAEQEKYRDISSFSAFLRETVYKMPLPVSFLPINKLR
jgi:putative hemolysin